MEEITQSPSEAQNTDFGDSSNNVSNSGIVYVLSNQAMPDYIKIGITSGDATEDVKRRMRELDNTSLPLPFQCEYAAVVRDYKQVEKALHVAFRGYRVERPREFFENLDPISIKAVIDLVRVKEVTPEETDIQNEDGSQIRVKKENFTFAMVNIPVGAILEFVAEPERTCRVAGSKTEVEYEGEPYSISGLTKLLKQIKQTHYSIQATRHWKYDGETLQARRERLEEENRGE